MILLGILQAISTHGILSTKQAFYNSTFYLGTDIAPRVKVVPGRGETSLSCCNVWGAMVINR